jgi:hypothetical protein
MHVVFVWQKLDAKFSTIVPSSLPSQPWFYKVFLLFLLLFICINIVLFKFLKSNLTIMAPPKLSPNFKYKAWFCYRFLTFALELSTFESPPLEALNDLDSSLNHNVASFSNTIIVKIIVNLEQDPRLPKIQTQS